MAPTLSPPSSPPTTIYSAVRWLRACAHAPAGFAARPRPAAPASHPTSTPSAASMPASRRHPRRRCAVRPPASVAECMPYAHGGHAKSAWGGVNSWPTREEVTGKAVRFPRSARRARSRSSAASDTVVVRPRADFSECWPDTNPMTHDQRFKTHDEQSQPQPYTLPRHLPYDSRPKVQTS